jgi:rRNA-processing protein FCF1
MESCFILVKKEAIIPGLEVGGFSIDHHVIETAKPNMARSQYIAVVQMHGLYVLSTKDKKLRFVVSSVTIPVYKYPT